MTSLPSGLASISSRLDDTPNVRGAAEEMKTLGLTSAADHIWRPTTSLTDTLGSAIDRHAQLAVGSCYKSADRRV
jgi:hypothetical protein